MTTPTSRTDLTRQFYEMLLESQYWPQDQLVDFQRSQLEQLLRHARKNVPFYENRLDPVFRPNGSIDLDRWRDIPILKRQDMIEHREAMLARELPKGHEGTHDSSTSGSTGQPITVRSSAVADMALKAAIYRTHRWHELDWSRSMLAWRGVSDVSRLPHGYSAGKWGPDWDSSAAGELIYVFRNEQPRDVIEFMRRQEIAYLASRPQQAQALALDAVRLGAELPLSGILTFGTGIGAAEREDCRAAFGAEMWANYSSKEVGLIAHQCPHGQLHAISEIGLIEIIDDAGRPALPGEMGRVIVTSIFNAAQPIIRYDQGDLALAGSVCTCGRTLPTVGRIVGRQTHLFRFPDGRTVAPNIHDRYREVLGAQYWQIAQIGPTAFEVRYVPFPGQAADQPAFAKIVSDHLLRDDLTITFSPRDELAREGSKFIQYVYEVETQ